MQPPNKQVSPGLTKSAATTVQPSLPGTVELTHSQSIRQSANYQSIEAFYCAKTTCRDNPAEIKKAIAHLESVVEAPLVSKIAEQRNLLDKLAS